MTKDILPIGPNKDGVDSTLPLDCSQRASAELAPAAEQLPASAFRSRYAIPGGVAPVRDKLTEHRWKRGKEENPEAVEVAEAWKHRVAPSYNKGAVQVVGAGEAPFIGRK